MAQHVLAAAGWLTEGMQGLFIWFKSIGIRYRAYQLKKQTIAELHKCSDRELNDMGLHRGAIHGLPQQQYEDVVNKNLKGWV